MIVTVNANTTLDLTLTIPEWDFNRTFRATSSITTLGGKPSDASWILGEMGIVSRALGFAGGATGKKVESLLQAQGVIVEFDWVADDTRTNVVISVEGQGQTTITTVTMTITPEQIAALRARFIAVLEDTSYGIVSCVVLGGTLPRGMDGSFYVDLITLASERNIPAIFDADKPLLAEGLSARPTYIKPNEHELERLVGYPVETLDQAYHAGRAILTEYSTIPIITLGKRGALAVLPNIAYHIPPIAVDVVSASGAGDAMLAGIAASIERGQPIEEGIRLGAAAAAAVLLMPGTAVCQRADIERFLPQVQLIPFEP